MTSPIQQIGVLPYREIDGQLHIMAITARRTNGTYWITPKGHLETGLSAPETAALEAEEEAGVRGIVGHTPIGVYHYRKYDRDYAVAVYPLQVETVLEASQWPEHTQRQRCLLAAEKAAATMANAELGAIITAFARSYDRRKGNG